MKLQINGEARTFESPTAFTLAALVESLGLKPDRVAIELNRDIVPRDRWSDTTLNDGDQLEVVHFVGGGSVEGQPFRAALGSSNAGLQPQWSSRNSLSH